MPEQTLTDQIALREEQGSPRLTRDETIKAIRAALKARSGKAWSVRGDRGTAYGWITISSPKARRTGRMIERTETINGRMDFQYDHIDAGEYTGFMSPQDCAELGELLNLGKPCHYQGESIAASTAHYIEYIARAEGRSPSTYGHQYWD